MVSLREDEVRLLRLLVEGASNSTAAKRQGIALRTMELHRQKVMRKLGAKSAAQLGYLFAKYEDQVAEQQPRDAQPRDAKPHWHAKPSSRAKRH